MKKIYILFVLVLFSAFTFGQTLISESFNSGQMPPSGWTIPAFADQWTASNTAMAGGMAPEAKFSTFAYNGTLRFLSPMIDLTGYESVTLIFKHFYDDQGGSGPVVGVATRAQWSSWHTVWSASPTGNQGPEEIVVTIDNEDVNKPQFQICFYLEGNMAGIDSWYFDDILLLYPLTFDCQLASIGTPSTVTGAEPVFGVVRNVGQETVTEVSLSFESFNGSIYDTTYTGLSLGSFDDFEFEFDQMWLQPFGSYDLTVWINHVNGTQDNDLSNDTLTKVIDYIPFFEPQLPCFEEFTSSTCGPCASFNSGFVPWCLTMEDEIVLIKYQMSWPSPGDPYYTAEGGVRRQYYGVNAVPNLFCNGANVSTNMSAVQSAYNAAVTRTTSIDIASKFTITGTNINIVTNILPFENAGTKKVHVIVMEKVTTGNVMNNGETEFHHVMMKMMPDANGTTVNLQSMSPISLNHSYDLSTTNVEEYDDIIVAVVIQDQSSKEIIQSVYGPQNAVYSPEARLSDILVDGVSLEGFDPDVYEYEVVLPEGTVEEPFLEGIAMDDGARVIVSPAFEVPGTAIIDVYAENLMISARYLIHYTIFTGTEEMSKPSVQVFPNPAKDHLYVTGLKDARIILSTMDGKTVLSRESFSGNTLDVSSLPKGVYILHIQMENSNTIQKKIILL